MTTSYNQAKSDHDYLWNTYGPAADMTGGYVDSEDLALMLENPTKKQAEFCLIAQIEYWFMAGPEPKEAMSKSYVEINFDDPRIVEIAKRNGITI